MSEEMTDYRAWVADLHALLDALEFALPRKGCKRARKLLSGRFGIAEKHGAKIEWTGQQTGGMQ